MDMLPRQVKLRRCSLIVPGFDERVTDTEDQRVIAEQGVDISDYVQQINIFESVFENTLSGSITLLEDVGLIEYLPIVGVELLVIVFSVELGDGEERTFARTFRVTKVADQTYPRHNFRMYTLRFVTPEFIRNISSRVSRKYRGVTCQEAVTDILTRDLKVSPQRILNNDTTIGKLDIVLPKYTPLQAINLFTIYAQNEQQESNFVFFETLEGFHFTSIARLIKDGQRAPMKRFTVDPSMLHQPKIDDERVRNTITRIQQDNTFDVLADIASGTLRSKMIHFDFLSRKLEVEADSKYSDTFSETTHLDAHPVYPKNFELSVTPDVRIFTLPSNVWLMNSAYVKSKGEYITEQNLREAIVRRNRQMHEIRHLQTLVDMPGQPDLRAGSVVRIEYPSSAMLERRDVTINTPVHTKGTPYHSGPHLITSVHHILSRTGQPALQYRMQVRACRDSLGTAMVSFPETPYV